jgi:hypothetical protein
MIWTTPNGQTYLNKIYDDLALGKNVVLVVPKPLSDEQLLENLSDLLLKNNFILPVYNLSKIIVKSLHPLRTILRNAVDWELVEKTPDFNSQPTLNDMFQSLASANTLKFLALTGLNTLSPASQTGLADDVAKWARFPNQLSQFGKPSGLRLVLITQPTFQEIGEDLLLSRHIFWGIIRQSDTDWAVTRLLNEMYSSPSLDNDESALTEYLFLKSLCLGLCSEDFQLIENILKARPKGIEDLERILENIPLRKAIQKLDIQYLPEVPTRHPSLNWGRIRPVPTSHDEIALWSQGVLSATGQTGIHPVFLFRDDLEKAVATAQREVFLPIVDHVHSLLISAIEMAYGKEIWKKFSKNDNHRKAILSEISPLAFFIRDKVKITQNLSKHYLNTAINCAFAWREIRHATSHNTMADYQLISKAVKTFNAFASHYDRLKQSSQRTSIQPKHV